MLQKENAEAEIHDVYFVTTKSTYKLNDIYTFSQNGCVPFITFLNREAQNLIFTFNMVENGFNCRRKI